MDAWDCLPEMVVATETNQHQYDHRNGVLNHAVALRNQWQRLKFGKRSSSLIDSGLMSA